MPNSAAALAEDVRDSIDSLNEFAARLAERRAYFPMLEAFPGPAYILNRKRQVLHANRQAVEEFGSELGELLGRRPGEFLHCEYSPLSPRGCGTSRSCRVCGILGATREALASGQTVRKTALLTLGRPGDSVPLRSFELMVTATPIRDGTEDFLVLAIEDRSDRSRREAVERIFFHDLLNSLSVLKSSAELLKRDPDEKVYIEYIARAVWNLEEEVLRQRDLRLAERGELAVHPKAVSSLALLHDLVVEYSLADFAQDRVFVLDGHLSESVDFETDPLLLRRTLGNMMRNAFEASRPGDRVSTSTRREGEEVLFEVSNPAVIPEEDQLKIFRRSYSTKGRGRGLGTYSMRLITEGCLKGSLGFRSAPGTGTTFWIRLPLALPG